MLTISESKDYSNLAKFMQGEGIIRLCAGGQDVPKDAIEPAMEKSGGIFLLAKEGEKEWGFMTLQPEYDGAYSLHLCLRTIGSKTREFMGMAIEYARGLGVKELLGYHPVWHRGAAKIVKEFNFIRVGYRGDGENQLIINSLSLNN
jgi:hypothetical protein